MRDEYEGPSLRYHKGAVIYDDAIYIPDKRLANLEKLVLLFIDKEGPEEDEQTQTYR